MVCGQNNLRSTKQRLTQHKKNGFNVYRYQSTHNLQIFGEGDMSFETLAVLTANY